MLRGICLEVYALTNLPHSYSSAASAGPTEQVVAVGVEGVVGGLVCW